MKVGDICNRNVTIIGKHDTIFTAARLMHAHRVNDVVMVESYDGLNIPQGILSDRDIVISVIAEGLDLNRTLIKDVVPNDLLTVAADDDVMATLKRMRKKGIRRTPVISQTNGLIGILSIDNILDAIVEQLIDIDHIIAGTNISDKQLNLSLAN